MNIKEKNIECGCGGNVFSINLNKVESVGLVTCKKCGKNYFILDSGDYWYDTIQEKYPSIVKCSKCKSETFTLQLTYEFRENSEDIRYIEITGLCKNCGSTKKLGTWEIDYSPTDSLIESPIVFCENPKIKYELSTNTCYWTPQDLINLLEFLYSLDLSIYCRHNEDGTMLVQKLDKKETMERASSLKYYEFFVSLKDISITENKEMKWKKEEVVRVSSPISMNLGGKIGENVGLLFYIEYSTNYIDDFKSGIVKEKSPEFKRVIEKIEYWLKANYTSLRGKNSFDNLEEHKRLFGDRFLKQ